MARLVCLFATLVILVSPTTIYAARLATWLGGTGLWSDPTKWDIIPPAGDDVFPSNNGEMEFDVVFGFDSGDRVTLTDDYEINNLHFLDGTINVATHELTIKSTPYPPGSIWEADSTSFAANPTMTGSGTIRIPQGGTLNIEGGGRLLLGQIYQIQ